jgi:hypothetical protein
MFSFRHCEIKTPPETRQSMKRVYSAVSVLCLLAVAAVRGADGPATNPAAPDAFKSQLHSTLTRHLNLLFKKDGALASFKGKTAEGDAALAFYLMFEITGEPKFRTAAVELANEVLRDMRATKFGVLPIKEKDKAGGTVIMGGGPPALGAYASSVAYILHKEGGRSADLKYIGYVLDHYPWNENGWWASTIDVKTGESKEPMSKPAIINKTAAVAMAAGIVSALLGEIDPEVAARLKQKTDRCIYGQIIPAQEPDGFWHYSLTGNDPKEKDVLGYFMLTTKELMTLQRFNPAYREAKLNDAVKKAQAFALKFIAPTTEPNTGSAARPHATQGTPSHYSVAEDPKRSYQLGFVLLGGGYHEEGIKIVNAALRHFPIGNAGQDGAHAAQPVALILSR